ncbi:50S rRNA methyltransferase, partial [Francisella tularensis]
MAFLLDIITFLQISFSTNIFRINYNFRILYKLNNYLAFINHLHCISSFSCV